MTTGIFYTGGGIGTLWGVIQTPPVANNFLCTFYFVAGAIMLMMQAAANRKNQIFRAQLMLAREQSQPPV